MDDIIFVSIASYRDPDLINTIKSCISNAENSSRIFFSIFSQAEDGEHPDLSFIPENQIRYEKTHWSNSLGACWARDIATSNVVGTYFLQVDSHSRFSKNWDTLIINNLVRAEKFWGNRVILTSYPDPFEISKDGSDNLIDYSDLKKLEPFWDDNSKMIQAKHDWPSVIDTDNGDEVFFFSANCAFMRTQIIKEIPYDKNLYFTGEEPSIAIRAYTRGIRLVSPTVKFMYTNYNRDNYKRNLHWEDHEKWWQMNVSSYQRLSKIMSEDKSLGIFSIGSVSLFKQYQKITGIDLSSKSMDLEE